MKYKSMIDDWIFRTYNSICKYKGTFVMCKSGFKVKHFSKYKRNDGFVRKDCHRVTLYLKNKHIYED